jgi:hypothetical protein
MNQLTDRESKEMDEARAPALTATARPPEDLQDALDGSGWDIADHAL